MKVTLDVSFYLMGRAIDFLVGSGVIGEGGGGGGADRKL